MRKALLILSLILLLPNAPLYASSAPSAAADYAKANRLFIAAQYKEALPLYKSVLVYPPDNTPASDINTKIGDCYYHLGVYTSAIEAYRKALRTQDRVGQPVTRYWIGFCYFLLGRDEQAVSEFLKIPELYPEAGMWVGTAYYWSGRACERLGWKDQARAYYSKAGGNGKTTQGRFALKKAEAVGRSQSSK